MIPTKPSQTEPYGSFVSECASDLWHKVSAQVANLVHPPRRAKTAKKKIAAPS
jgi:hypothetical protein